MNFIKLKFFFGIVFIVITETYPRAQGTLITGNPFYLTYDLIHYALCTHDPGVAFFALELVNDKGNPVIQQKLKTEQGRFSGAMNLKHDMPTGIYWIRAYSAATGLSENSVCYCPVVIINPDDLAGNRWKKIILNPAGKISFHFLNPADPTAGAGEYQASFIDEAGKIITGSGFLKDMATGTYLKIRFNDHGLFRLPATSGHDFQAILTLASGDSLSFPISPDDLQSAGLKLTGPGESLKSNDSFRLTPGKPEYQPRDSVSIDLAPTGDTSFPADSSLIISVSELDQALVDFNKSPTLVIEDKPTVKGSEGTVQGGKGHDFMLRGTYINPVTNKPRVNYTVALIGLGRIPSISIANVDQSGRFTFDMQNSTENDHYYLSTISSSSEGLSWKDAYFRDTGEKPVVYFDSADRAALNSFAETAKTRDILHKQYDIRAREESIGQEQGLYDTTKVYPRPDLSYPMSDYIQFDDLEDAIKNILNTVHLVKSKKGSHIFIYNNQSLWLSRYPVFLVNGIPTRDDSLVLRLNINDIKRIDILDLQASLAPFGLAGMGGIMAIYTSKKISLPGCLATGIAGLHEQVTEFSPVLNDEFPDLSPVVYWNTGVNLSRHHGPVSFRLNDVLSDLKITVTGFDASGKIIQSGMVIKINKD